VNCIYVCVTHLSSLPVKNLCVRITFLWCPCSCRVILSYLQLLEEAERRKDVESLQPDDGGALECMFALSTGSSFNVSSETHDGILY
jgi:hypothetical protein